MLIKSVRTKEEMYPVLAGSEPDGPDFAYWVFSGVAKDRWENMTILAPGKYGQEYVKTYGHYHSSPNDETYHVVQGNGLLLMQERYFEGDKWIKSKIAKFIVVKLTAGDEVLITQKWGHALCNTSTEPLITFDNWTSGHSPEDYTPVEYLKGLAYYVLEKDGSFTLEPNKNYLNHPEPEFMSAQQFAELSK